MVGKQFESLARAVVRSQDMPDFPLVVVADNLEEKDEEELRALAEELFPRLLGELGIREPVPQV